MTLRTLVSQCKDVPDRQGVSYVLRYHTSGPSTLALIPMGYADGVPRVATGGPVRVAVTGRTVSPPLYESMELLGRERSLGRLRAGFERARTVG